MKEVVAVITLSDDFCKMRADCWHSAELQAARAAGIATAIQQAEQSALQKFHEADPEWGYDEKTITFIERDEPDQEGFYKCYVEAKIKYQK